MQLTAARHTAAAVPPHRRTCSRPSMRALIDLQSHQEHCPDQQIWSLSAAKGALVSGLFMHWQSNSSTLTCAVQWLVFLVLTPASQLGSFLQHRPLYIKKFASVISSIDNCRVTTRQHRDARTVIAGFSQNQQRNHLVLGEHAPRTEARNLADQRVSGRVHNALLAGVVAHVHPATALTQEHRRVAACAKRASSPWKEALGPRSACMRLSQSTIPGTTASAAHKRCLPGSITSDSRHTAHLPGNAAKLGRPTQPCSPAGGGWKPRVARQAAMQGPDPRSCRLLSRLTALSTSDRRPTVI